MILGHHELVKRIYELFPDNKPYKIGSASVDVRVGDWVMLENDTKIDISEHSEYFPWIMEPGQFLKVCMLERTVVPYDLSSLFLLKSTLARVGMSHCFAGWVDPHWDGVLTMEIKNYNQERPLPLWPGMPIGQMIYMRTEGAGTYRGRYQHSEGVVGAREEIEYDAGK
jgi:dCTP deaminase